MDKLSGVRSVSMLMRAYAATFTSGEALIGGGVICSILFKVFLLVRQGFRLYPYITQTLEIVNETGSL